jgi:tRNA-specific adenosine deaminase 2
MQPEAVGVPPVLKSTFSNATQATNHDRIEAPDAQSLSASQRDASNGTPTSHNIAALDAAPVSPATDGFTDTEGITYTAAERTIHETYMREAINEAKKALEQLDETPVGCILVHNPTGGSSSPQIIARGHNLTNTTLNGTRHAEFVAIASLYSQGHEVHAILRQSTLYVTVEPCIMCASLLLQYGIQKVYYGATNDKFGGTGGVLSIHQPAQPVEPAEPARHRQRQPPSSPSNLTPPDLSSSPSTSSEGSKREQEEERFDGENASMGRRGGQGQARKKGYPVSGSWLRDEAVLLLRRFYVQENGNAPEPKARGKEGRVLKTEDLHLQIKS